LKQTQLTDFFMLYSRKSLK